MIYQRPFTFLLAAALLLAATSCVKDELHDTPHPDTGKITVTADWTDRGDGVDIPAEWSVTMGDYTGTETGETHAPDYLFAPGNYTLAVYNTPENITISGTIATVAPDSKVRVGQKEEFQGLQVPFSATLISNAPGWLLTSVQEMTVEADTDHELTAAMHQQVRQLTLVIEPTGDAADRIESTEGSLSGAAGAFDFAAGTYGAASDVALRFTKITEGEDAGKWTATVRLLGITGNTQTLTATLTYADGNPTDTSLESDMTAALLTVNLTEVQPTSGSYIAPSLILFPQEVTSIPITVTVGGQDYTATLSVKDGKLQSGNNYTWEITVSKTDMSVGKAEIKNWETVDNGGTTATM